VPAFFVTWFYGEAAIAGLLIASQVVLSLQLPFAIVPLIRYTSSRAVMGAYANAGRRRAGGADRALIAALNVVLVVKRWAEPRLAKPDAGERGRQRTRARTARLQRRRFVHSVCDSNSPRAHRTRRLGRARLHLLLRIRLGAFGSIWLASADDDRSRRPCRASRRSADRCRASTAAGRPPSRRPAAPRSRG
jgi:hypothetical protein